eukprot:scaffold220763_cov62-Attheya_sp.AAC.2
MILWNPFVRLGNEWILIDEHDTIPWRHLEPIHGVSIAGGAFPTTHDSDADDDDNCSHLRLLMWL